MIITDSFVFLNYPKTGSTFVRQAISEAYRRKQRSCWPWLRNKKSFEMCEVPNVRDTYGARRGTPNPHGTYWQIPNRAKHLPVYCVHREPLKRMVSGYFFADWKRPEVWRGELNEIREKYPEFPELSISDYVKYINEFLLRELVIGDIKFGFLASDYVHFFLKDSELAGRKTIEFSDLEALKDAIGTVKFLKNDSLNEELSLLLTTHGFTKKDVRFIDEKERVNVSASSQQKSGYERQPDIIQECHRDVALVNYLSGYGDLDMCMREIQKDI